MGAPSGPGSADGQFRRSVGPGQPTPAYVTCGSQSSELRKRAPEGALTTKKYSSPAVTVVLIVPNVPPQAVAGIPGVVGATGPHAPLAVGAKSCVQSCSSRMPAVPVAR